MTWGSVFEARDLVRILYIRRAGSSCFFPNSPLPSLLTTTRPSSLPRPPLLFLLLPPLSLLYTFLFSSSCYTLLYSTLSLLLHFSPSLLSSSRRPPSLAATRHGRQHQVRVSTRSLSPSSTTDTSLVVIAPQVHNHRRRPQACFITT